MWHRPCKHVVEEDNLYREDTMTLEFVFGGIISFLLMIYLFYSLIRPEDF